MTAPRIPIHREPDCLGAPGCTYPEPHRHGYACDRTCEECHHYCHPDCPAWGDELIQELLQRLLVKAAVLDVVDELHVTTDGRDCVECARPWPCETHLAITEGES